TEAKDRHLADVVLRDHATRIEFLLLQSAGNEALDHSLEADLRLGGNTLEFQTGVIDRKAVGPDGKTLESRTDDPTIRQYFGVSPAKDQAGLGARGQRRLMLDPRTKDADVDEHDRRRTEAGDHGLGKMNPLYAASAGKLHEWRMITAQPINNERRNSSIPEKVGRCCALPRSDPLDRLKRKAAHFCAAFRKTGKEAGAQ
ncbi:MAG: hypothetical protein ABI837_11320, partial [Acidobacteriota bacterium]